MFFFSVVFGFVLWACESKNMKANSLEARLMRFASDCVVLQTHLFTNAAGLYYGKQLIRSAAYAALNYGESQGAASGRDFGHKLSSCLKESCESLNNLKSSSSVICMLTKNYARTTSKNVMNWSPCSLSQSKK